MDINKEIFEKDIMELLGLQNLPEEDRLSLMAKMTELIQNKISFRILGEMADEDKENFDKLMDGGDGEKINEFLKSKLPNLDEIALEEVAKFKQDLVENIEGIRQRLLTK